MIQQELKEAEGDWRNREALLLKEKQDLEKTLLNQLSSANLNCERQSHEIKALTLKLNEQSTKISTLETEAAELTASDSRGQLESELKRNQLEKKVNDMSKELALATQECRSYKEETEKLMSIRENESQANAGLKGIVEVLKKKNQDLEEKLTDKKNELMEKKTEILSAKKQLSQSRQQLEALCEKTESQVLSYRQSKKNNQNLTRKVEKQEKLLKQKDCEVERVKKECKEIKTLFEHQKLDLEKIKLEKVELSKKNQDLITSFNSLQQVAESRSKAIENLTQESLQYKSNLQKEVQVKAEELGEYKEKLKLWEEEAVKGKKERDRLQDLVSTLNTENSKLTDELKVNEDIIRKKEEDLLTTRSNFEDLLATRNESLKLEDVVKEYESTMAQRELEIKNLTAKNRQISRRKIWDRI